MTYGTYQSVSHAVNTFVYNELIDAALVPDPPQTLNLLNLFTDHLVAAQFNRLIAEEETEKHISYVRRRLDDAIDQWIERGLPAPLGYTNNQDVLVTWKHVHFPKITGRRPLSGQFVEIYEWLIDLGPRQFLLASAIFLRIIGCNPIFITDGPHDEGIDCIGKIMEGPIRSILVFVQSKTKENSRKLFQKETLYQEYGKYATLTKTLKYQHYLRALNFEASRDGSANVYFILANGEFHKGAEPVARNLGILLRSARQLAYFLSLHSSLDQLKKLQSTVTIPTGPDLTLNIASKIKF